MAELWVDQPYDRAKQMRRVGLHDAIFHKRVTHLKAIDPVKFMEVWFRGLTWRLIVFDESNGFTLTTSENGVEIENGPVWEFGVHSPKALERWCQEYPRVIMQGIPDLAKKASRSLVHSLGEMQLENPQCNMHMHGFRSFRWLFGIGFQSVTYSPWKERGSTILPNGRVVDAESLRQSHRFWLEMFGEWDYNKPDDVKWFNLCSAKWASENWGLDFEFSKTVAPPPPIGNTAELADWLDRTQYPVKRKSVNYAKAEPTDMLACDTCSLQFSCKVYREGSVCRVPQSKGSKIMELFGRGDAESAQDAVLEVLRMQEERAQLAIGLEKDRIKKTREKKDENGIEQFPEMDPETTKIVGEMARTAVSVAKMKQPTKSGLTINNNVAGQVNGPVPASLSPQARQAQIIAELEDKGWHINDITDELVETVGRTGKVPNAALPVSVEIANVLENELGEEE